MLCCGRRDGGRGIPIRSLSFLRCHPPVCPLARASLSERHTELPRSVSNHRLSPSCPSAFAPCRIDIAPENTLWVGAWWIGFLGAGAASLLISIPILGYPQRLPGTGLRRGSGIGAGAAPALRGACTHMHGCSWGLGSKGTASRVIPKWISPPWLSICRCYGFSLAAVGGGRMSRCVFPLQIHCFSSTRIPWLACSSTLFASHFQDPSATSL